MPKQMNTLFGLTEIHTESYSSKKARLQIKLPRQALKTLKASRISPANEPNTWMWSVTLEGICSETIIAPNAKAAVLAFLTH